MNIYQYVLKLANKGWNSPTIMTWGNMLSSSAKLLVFTPLILVRYNVDEIAFWYLLLTINTLIVVVDFGFYPTFSRIISYAYNGLDKVSDISLLNKKNNNGKPSWAFMARVYGTLNVTYVIMTGFVAVAVLLSATYSVYGIIKRTDNDTMLWTAYLLFVLSIVFAFLARRSDTVVIGTNHVALVNRWNIINNIANSISSILIVYFGMNIVWLAANQLLFSFLLLLRNYYMEKHICDGRFRNFSMFKFDKEIFKWIWSPTWKSGVLILSSTGITQLTGLLYSNMSSSAQLASYLLTLKLVSTVSQFSQAPFYSKLPAFSGLRVNVEISKLIDLSLKAMFRSLMVFVFGMFGLIYLGNYLLDFIGSKSSLESPIFMILMAFIWFFERNHAMHAQIYVTTNKIPFYKSAIVTGVINILSIYLLLPKLGVWSFPVAQGLSNAVINNWWNVKLSLTSLKSKFWPYFKKSAFVPLLLLIIFSAIRIILLYI